MNLQALFQDFNPRFVAGRKCFPLSEGSEAFSVPYYSKPPLTFEKRPSHTTPFQIPRFNFAVTKPYTVCKEQNDELHAVT